MKKLNKVLGKNQSGRSMVEMLGVLAVVGVLTIGGVAGYRYAMEKNKMNEFFYRLSLFLLERNVIVQQKNFLCYPNDSVGNEEYYNSVQMMKDVQELYKVPLIIGIGGYGTCNDYYVSEISVSADPVSEEFLEGLNSFVKNDLVEDIECQTNSGWLSFQDEFTAIKNQLPSFAKEIGWANFRFVVKEGSGSW